MHFENGWIFYLALFFLFCEWRCPMRVDLLYFSHIGRLARQKGRAWDIEIFKWIAWAGALTALASPVTVRYHRQTEYADRAWVVVADTLDTKRGEELAGWIQSRDGERVGLLIAPGRKGQICLPVSDRLGLTALVALQSEKHLKATALTAEALLSAVRLLRGVSARERMIVLWADKIKETKTVPFSSALSAVREAGIRLYLLGGIAALPKGLKAAFEKAGVDLLALKEGLRALTKRQPPVRREVTVAQTRYYFHYPLFIGAMALLIYLFLINRGESA